MTHEVNNKNETKFPLGGGAGRRRFCGINLG
jgi:hypothetical protein